MKIYLFTINGRPGFRTDWRDAQACLEDHLRDRRDVTDVYWGDEGDERWYARVYLYGSSHSDISANPEDDPYLGVNFETTDQLVWEMEVPSPDEPEVPVMMDPMMPGIGARLERKVITKNRKESVTEVVPQAEWEVNPEWQRGHILWAFVTKNALEFGMRWSREARGL